MCCTVSLPASADFFPLGNIHADFVVAGGRTSWAVSKDTSLPSTDTFLYIPRSYIFVSRQPAPEIYPAKLLGTGGGNIYQPDETWGMFPAYGMYRFDTGTQKWMKNAQILADPRIQNIVVGIGYSDDCHPYEVWLEFKNFSNNSTYLSRHDYCSGYFVSVSSAPNLSRVAVGGGEVWALDASNHPYRYDGVAQQFTLMPGSLSQLAVGVDGVWGIGAGGQAFEFNAITQSWDSIGSPVSAIWAGGDGVFARTCEPVVPENELTLARGGVAGGVRPCTNRLMRYEPVTRRFVDLSPANQPDSLSVGTGAGVLGVLPAMRTVMILVE